MLSLHDALPIAADGVETVDQDRVRISGVPVVGQLFHSRYSLDDLQERKRVGTAYLSGDRLFVDLDRRERFQPVTSVVVLNQNNASELQAPPRLSQDLRLPSGPPVGGSHLNVAQQPTISLLPPNAQSHQPDARGVGIGGDQYGTM